MDRKTTIFISLSIGFLVWLIMPNDVLAASVQEALRDDSTLNLWRFFRSLINWGMVAYLIFIAFANATRFNIDTYTIKKTLPSLILGFILANLSYSICLLVVNLSDSLSLTATSLAEQSTGSSMFSVMFDTGWPTGIAALIAVVYTVSIFGTGGFGLLIGFIAILAVLFFPLIILLLLNLMFIIRGYVITLLVVVAPLAFISMATPFSSKWFSRWWSFFSTWVFMKPIGFGLLAFGAIIMHAGVPNAAVAFIAGLATMVAAITIPWRAGGWINSAALNLSKRLGGIGASGTGGALDSLGNRIGKGATAGSYRESLGLQLNQLGKAVKATPYIKGQVEKQLEKKSARTAAEGKAAAASLLGDDKQVQALFEEEVGEEDKKIGDDENEILLVDRLEKAKTDAERTAILRKAHKNKLNHKFYKELYKRTALVQKLGLTAEAAGGDTDENRSRANIKIMGGNVDTNGNVTGDQAKRQNRLLAQTAKSNGYIGQANSLDTKGNIKKQGAGIPGQPGHIPGINDDAANSFGGTANDIASKANSDNWVARDNTGFSAAWLQAANKGTFNAFIDNERALTNLDGFTATTLKAIPRPQLEAQLRALPKSAVPTEWVGRTNKDGFSVGSPGYDVYHPMGGFDDLTGEGRIKKLLDQIYK